MNLAYGTGTMQRQRGISLLVVLILLLVSTLLGLAVLRSSNMQERMTANLRDRSLAYQATEAALVYATNLIRSRDGTPQDMSKVLPQPGDGCVDGVCPPPEDGQPDRWLDPGTAWIPVPDSAYDTEQLAAAPEYIIEYMGMVPSRPDACLADPKPIDCENPMYRITARTRAAGRAEVMLQANVINKIDVP